MKGVNAARTGPCASAREYADGASTEDTIDGPCIGLVLGLELLDGGARSRSVLAVDRARIVAELRERRLNALDRQEVRLVRIHHRDPGP